MKKKSELKEEIKELYKQIKKLTDERDREKTELWNRNLPKAIDKCFEQLNAAIKGLFYNVSYVHTDGGGYWFTYQIVGEKQVFNYAVRHSDIDEE